MDGGKRDYEGVGLKRMSTAEMEVLKGVLERIVYENEENGYVIDEPSMIDITF